MNSDRPWQIRYAIFKFRCGLSYWEIFSGFDREEVPVIRAGGLTRPAHLFLHVVRTELETFIMHELLIITITTQFSHGIWTV